MRKPLIRKHGRGQRKSDSKTRSAPIKGWNTRDAEAAMAPEYAITLDNWYPSTSEVTTRGGATYWTTGFPKKVESLMSYNGTTSEKLFAATDTGIYDITFTGALGASVSTVTNGQFQYINYSTLGGHYIVAVNGEDDLRLYDGTTWQAINAASTPAITGAPTDEFIGVNAHKSRIWFIRKGSMSAYYLPTASIAGAATEFPMGSIFKRGGYLMAMATWSFDGGNGPDDFAVFISSEGEYAVYSGTDPANAGTWQLVGVYFIGKPLGRRCYIKFGGDLLFITQAGLYPASKGLQSAVIDRKQAVSDVISGSFAKAAEAYKNNNGWQAIVFQAQTALFVNIPAVEGGTSYQYVMNTLTGAWCRFTGWNAYCWEIHKGRLFFGGKDFVAEAWVGSGDFNTNINYDCKQAFDYFGSRGVQKHFKLIRPMLKVDGEIAVKLAMDTDFSSDGNFTQVSFSPGDQAQWDGANWDEAFWADEYAVRRQWRSIPAKEGYCAAFRLQISSRSVTVGWSATDYIYEIGSLF